MIELIIHNSYSQIKGLKRDQMAKLRKLLSYTTDPQAAYRSGGFIRTYYLIDKKGFFPTGLVPRVYNWLEDRKIEPEIEDRRIRPKFTLGMFCIDLRHDPYAWQQEAAEQACLSQRGGIVATTGSGKSLVIALIASRLNVKTLVVVPSLEIKKQLQNTLYNVLGHNENIVVKNIDASDLERHADYDCLIIDECHHAAANTYQRLNKKAWNKIYYRFFLTATFFRNNNNENLLFEAICGQEIYRLTYKEAVKESIIVPVEAYYYELPKIPVKGYLYAEVYKELVVNREDRNALISDVMHSLWENDRCCLCLVKEIAHGNNIKTGNFVNGLDESSRRLIKDFNSGDVKSLVATAAIMGEGVDSKPAEYIIIAGLGKAKSQFMQMIGRGVRRYPGKDSCKIVLFKDNSHKFTLRHYQEQCKILKEEYGVIPVKIGE